MFFLIRAEIVVESFREKAMQLAEAGIVSNAEQGKDSCASGRFCHNFEEFLLFTKSLLTCTFATIV